MYLLSLKIRKKVKFNVSNLLLKAANYLNFITIIFA